MNQKPERIFSILAEGGSLSISRITVNGAHRFLTRHQEADLTDEGLGVNKQIGYSSFEEAFTYISKYPWHLLFMHIVHDDYRIQVLDRLMEVLNSERGEGEYYKESKLYDHQELLRARIYQDSSGEWRYSFDDFKPSGPEKYYK
ncbi:MAG TPA: hypothetical protein VFG54_19170 [Prolixibacteraceae bacterium]|nr:hypothetical protein [Prolixibacteraceae bacterium]